ncbi:MAG TPA: transglutaminase domain-containing protein [Casimicrobiaceae bacterium]|nr:transglutaminase domain-containing protein [Casimicrobiaceae bacterium]
MDRRDFLGFATGAAVSAAAGTISSAVAADAPTPPPTDAPWRSFEVVTDVEIWPQDLPLKLWLPIPQYGDTDYQRSVDIRWTGNPAKTGIYRDPRYGAPSFFAQWEDRASAPKLQVINRITTRNRSVDFSRAAEPHYAPREELDLYLQSTAHIPLSGIVRDTASRITPNVSADPMTRARAIYEWIVENTYRDPKVVGCGTGDIRFMLESGNLGGKCADLNALFVGLARSVGIPARDLYGVRVADSATWKSLGKSGDITRAQHCRAEFYHPRYGWVPVDPADVRKVILEEEKDRLLPLDDPRVKLARQTLFGAWEMNWIAFNTAGDTRLSPETAKPLGHFMYPYAEGAKGSLDYYDPQNFQYRMTAREV